MNCLMIISYDGSKFYGFQRLNDLTSVQKTLEEALCKICKTDVVVKGAGRTDRGVHAYGQCVSFKVNIDITLEGYLEELVRPTINHSLFSIDTDRNVKLTHSITTNYNGSITYNTFGSTDCHCWIIPINICLIINILNGIFKIV